jgi:hypothetical protein
LAMFGALLFFWQCSERCFPFRILENVLCTPPQ